MMMRTTFFAISSLALFAACSSGGGSGTTGMGGSTTSSHTTTTSTSSTTHMNMCVLTTDKGNADGVGAYCTPGGMECTKFTVADVCLADIGQSEWFCTKIGCTMNSDCGDGATCYMQTGGAACVPNKCLQGGTGGSGTGGGPADAGAG